MAPSTESEPSAQAQDLLSSFSLADSSDKSCCVGKECTVDRSIDDADVWEARKILESTNTADIDACII